MSDTDIIASLSYVFRSIRTCSERPPSSAYIFDATNGREKTVKNLGWLLRHTSDIVDLWVSTHTYRSLAVGGGLPFGRCSYEGFDVILAARLSGGLVYVTTWQDRSVLHDWLVRPNLIGRVVHWDCRAHVIGDTEYKEIKR